jgi:Domain of unknown function (DUF6378)
VPRGVYDRKKSARKAKSVVNPATYPDFSDLPPAPPSESARDVVMERRETHGDPRPTMVMASLFWNAWLMAIDGTEEVIRPIEPQDVPVMMSLFKWAREANRHNPDNLTDVCGWTDVYDLVRE